MSNPPTQTTTESPTTPRCMFCRSPAAALVDMPTGCLCDGRRYQYRCVQHMLRASDTDERYSVVATFPDYAILQGRP